MPSGEHESPIALAKLDSGLVAWLLAHLFDVKVPDYHHARSQPTDVRVLVPRTYHADEQVEEVCTAVFPQEPLIDRSRLFAQDAPVSGYGE